MNGEASRGTRRRRDYRR